MPAKDHGSISASYSLASRTIRSSCVRISCGVKPLTRDKSSKCTMWFSTSMNNGNLLTNQLSVMCDNGIQGNAFCSKARFLASAIETSAYSQDGLLQSSCLVTLFLGGHRRQRWITQLG